MNRWTQFLIAVGSVVAAAILVLADDYSETFIRPYLESLGHTVTSDTNYYDWDGTMSAETDIILYLYGYELGEYGNQAAANQSVLDFVAGGGLYLPSGMTIASLMKSMSQ